MYTEFLLFDRCSVACVQSNSSSGLPVTCRWVVYVCGAIGSQFATMYRLFTSKDAPFASDYNVARASGYAMDAYLLSSSILVSARCGHSTWSTYGQKDVQFLDSRKDTMT